jgi:hypothetical protein|nr:MAG TPA: hypothetical protein [Caudoviricetes sp.]
MGFDNDYDAFQFDLGVAWKGYLLEKEWQNQLITVLLNGMRNIVLSNGAKMDKIPQPAPLIKPKDYGELPSLESILAQFGGSGVIKK